MYPMYCTLSCLCPHSLPEFLLFKLKELGKLDFSDVYAICQEFEQLDVDNDGDLDAGEIARVGPCRV